MSKPSRTNGRKAEPLRASQRAGERLVVCLICSRKKKRSIDRQLFFSLLFFTYDVVYRYICRKVPAHTCCCCGLDWTDWLETKKRGWWVTGRVLGAERKTCMKVECRGFNGSQLDPSPHLAWQSLRKRIAIRKRQMLDLNAQAEQVKKCVLCVFRSRPNSVVIIFLWMDG